jgi:hypothetical protein
MAKQTVPPNDMWLAVFRESAGLTPPPRTLSDAASRLVDLVDEFLCSLQHDWDPPPGFPRERFVPTGYGKRDLIAPIIQYVNDFGFTGDARRLQEATRRFYAHRDWKLMIPSPGDDKGWKEFQERYVKPLGYEVTLLQGILRDVRQLIITACAKGSTGPTAKDGGNVAPKTPKLPEPPKAAWLAYYVRHTVGITKQTEIAETMTEQGTPATQGQVSKWLKAVDAWLEAGGIRQTIEQLHEQPKSIDPAKLDMGARQDGRTPAQRDKMTDPADDWN